MVNAHEFSTYLIFKLPHFQIIKLILWQDWIIKNSQLV